DARRHALRVRCAAEAVRSGRPSGELRPRNEARSAARRHEQDEVLGAVSGDVRRARQRRHDVPAPLRRRVRASLRGANAALVGRAATRAVERRSAPSIERPRRYGSAEGSSNASRTAGFSDCRGATTKQFGGKMHDRHFLQWLVPAVLAIGLVFAEAPAVAKETKLKSEVIATEQINPSRSGAPQPVRIHIFYLA